MLRNILFIFFLFTTTGAVATNQTAIFAGGCFWCMQSDFDQLKGVVSTTVGYDGGQQKNPTYEKVADGGTNYAESIKVVYDDRQLSYNQVLNYFWKNIDPTVKDAQFCDLGHEYRSAIFYLNMQQKEAAETSLVKIKKLFTNVYTEITPSTHFYSAEEYHQDFYLKNPTRYKFYRWSCRRDKRLATVWQGKKIQ